MSTESTPTPGQRCARAREHLLAGDAREAFREARPVLAYPAAPEGPLLREALDVMRAIAAALGDEKLAGALGWAGGRLDDTEALYDAAYALYEQKLHDLAAAS